MDIKTENKHFDKCYKIYQKKGIAGVIEYGNKHSIPYRYCKYCECDTPQINHDCLACGSRN